jgi:hypothetical protein
MTASYIVTIPHTIICHRHKQRNKRFFLAGYNVRDKTIAKNTKKGNAKRTPKVRYHIFHTNGGDHFVIEIYQYKKKKIIELRTMKYFFID